MAEINCLKLMQSMFVWCNAVLCVAAWCVVLCGPYCSTIKQQAQRSLAYLHSRIENQLCLEHNGPP